MPDNHGYVLSPLPVAPVNATDILLLPDGLKALKRVAKMVGLDLEGAYLTGCLKTCQTSQATDHEMDHRHTDHGFTRLG
jgi:uncharacterized protein YjlB